MVATPELINWMGKNQLMAKTFLVWVTIAGGIVLPFFVHSMSLFIDIHTILSSKIFWSLPVQVFLKMPVKMWRAEGVSVYKLWDVKCET